jgi:hypothetical protein
MLLAVTDVLKVGTVCVAENEPGHPLWEPHHRGEGGTTQASYPQKEARCEYSLALYWWSSYLDGGYAGAAARVYPLWVLLTHAW